MGELAAARVILARLFGGLGNQMFQYACARRLAHRLGTELKLDLSTAESYGPRKYALDGLNISAQLATAAAVKSIQRRARISDHLPRRLLDRIPGWRYEVFRERSFAFDPAVLELRGNILLEGYWQSERYFADIADIVRLEFSPAAAPAAGAASHQANIRDTNAVSVHVRRGDYVSNPGANRYHGVCDLDYYRRAVEIITRTEPQPHFFVFSDDPEWAAQNLRLGFPTVVVESAGGDDGARADLHLMSLCRHHIIANSSFSWWGAWLNPKPEKKVVAPQKWFAAGARDTRDLVPADWMRI